MVAAEAGPAPIMVDYDAENGVDGVDALSKAIQALKSVAWENEEIMWFFNQAEIRMQTAGVKKQWTKLQALTTILPKKVTDQLKKLLMKKES